MEICGKLTMIARGTVPGFISLPTLVAVSSFTEEEMPTF